jgi:hypothetical protein
MEDWLIDALIQLEEDEQFINDMFEHSLKDDPY